MGGIDPDDPQGNPFEWWAAKKDTENYIADFMKGRGLKPKCGSDQ